MNSFLIAEKSEAKSRHALDMSSGCHIYTITETTVEVSFHFIKVILWTDPHCFLAA